MTTPQNEKEFVESLRGTIEKRLWEEYDPDIAPNMEALTDEILSIITRAIQYGTEVERGK